ncbi:MAG TPA: methyltransferase domain-containing protein [Candidatus Limnocylindrales bacterium]
MAAVPAPRPSDEELGERRLATFRQILGTLPPGRLLDLGAGHGAFSKIGQELGWTVTAVDARTERMPMGDGIRWVQADARTFDVSGYDCIALLGLLYHLGLDDQRDLLRRCSGTPTILDTHHALSPWLTVDGWEGGIYQEPGSTPEELASVPTASWGNTDSFWPTRASLLRMLDEAGYRTILALEPPILPDRTFYLCL